MFTISRPFLGVTPVFRVDLGVAGRSFTISGRRYRPDIGAEKDILNF